MDDIDKSKVRLKHWIDHNFDHIKGYEEVAQVLAEKGFSDAAASIRSAAKAIAAANVEFEKALESLAGAAGEGDTKSPAHDEPDSHHGDHKHNHGHGCDD